jgi:hypothetical protein
VLPGVLELHNCAIGELHEISLLALLDADVPGDVRVELRLRPRPRGLRDPTSTSQLRRGAVDEHDAAPDTEPLAVRDRGVVTRAAHRATRADGSRGFDVTMSLRVETFSAETTTRGACAPVIH